VYGCVRGATTVSRNEKEEVLSAARELLTEIINANGLSNECIISIIFSSTPDITAAYPAEAAREMGLTEAGLCCYQEMNVSGSLPMCLRVLVNVESEKKQNEMRHVYLHDAKCLRPDLTRQHKFRAIAIDGPSGSGKSTAARNAAKKLGFIYVDTGAMYRAAALYFLENGADISDEEAVKLSLKDINVEIGLIDCKQRIILNGADVTDKIRTQPVADATSKTAAIKAVRDKFVTLQRKIAASNDIVMDGRDIGTVVLPGAMLKIYMDAPPEIRAKRRVGELFAKGIAAEYDQILKEIIIRDKRDAERVNSPLKIAVDAVYIDTAGMNEEETADCIVNLFKSVEKG